MTSQGPVIAAPTACTYCGLCASICPTDAVTLTYEIVWGPSDCAQ
jgi:ferredoxin